MNKKYIILGCILTLTIGISSCNKEKKEGKKITKIVVAPSKIQVGVGNTININASPFPDDDVAFVWSSDSPDIATVDQQGAVTGVTGGDAIVTVSYGLITKSIPVEVYEPLSDINLSPSALTVELKIEFGVAEFTQYTVTPVPANSTESITWKSSNVKVASVSSTGLITATGGGSAVITVQGSIGTIMKEIAVTVKKIGDDPVQFDSKLFKRSILPGDNYQDRNEYWYLESIWDGNTETGGGSSCGLEGPQSFTLDMGQSGLLAYFHLFTWKSINEGYPPFSESNVKKFEVWGSESLDPSGSWDSWTKLMDCDVAKPSGLPIYEYNDADLQACNNGQKFYNVDNYNVPVRYIRVKVIETWEGTPCWRISEIKLFGRPQ